MWGGASNLILQFLNLTFGIWLSRILSVEDYGTIGVLTIFTLIATTLQESGFTQAIANKKSPSHNDFNAIFWCSSAIGLTTYITLFFLAPSIATFFNNPDLVPLARFLFLGFVFASLGTAHNAYIFKNMMVKERAISMIIGLTFSGTIGVVLAYNNYAYWGLAIQHVTYVICTNLLFSYFTKWKPTLKIDLKPIKSMFRFSYKILITKLCIHLNNHIFNIILGHLFNKREVGVFTQANKWNLMGSSIITEMIQGVAQPLFRETAEIKNIQEDVFLKILRFTAFIAFPTLLGLAYTAPEFITILLTEKWTDSAYLLRILCVGGAFLPLNHLLANFIISTGKSSIYMWNTIALLVSQIAAAILLYPLGIKYMMYSFVILQVIWFFIWYIFIKRELNISIYKLLTQVFPYLLYSAITIGLSTVCLQYISNIYLLLFLKIAIVFSSYLLLLLLKKDYILKETIYYIKKTILTKK